MTTYPYPTPSLSDLKFSKLFKESPFLFTSDIELLNARREVVKRVFDKGARGGEAGLKALEEYIPSLLALAKTLSKDVKGESTKNVPEVTWRPVLSKKKGNVTCASIWFEVAEVLLSYGFTLCTLSNTVLAGPPPLPSSSATSPTSPTSDRFNMAADYLTRASGVFEFWANDKDFGSPRWLNLPVERPTEVVGDVARALSIICLADAQRIAIQKAQTLSLGTSLALLAKLALGASSLYRDAYAKLSGLPGGEIKDLSKEFVGYVKDMGETICVAQARGMIAEVKFGEEQNGEAVALITDARNRLALAARSSDSPTIREIASKELPQVETALAKYKKTNDMVTMQHVPTDENEIAVLMPSEGKTMMATKKFVVPTLAFEH
ncbi:hypothetical protein HK104_009718 [Borealophlyctis nickersoniae]|nr:hypothetical protein HK104_009718 [Borealophlyctis nickersoniae]